MAATTTPAVRRTDTGPAPWAAASRKGVPSSPARRAPAEPCLSAARRLEGARWPEREEGGEIPRPCGAPSRAGVVVESTVALSIRARSSRGSPGSPHRTVGLGRTDIAPKKRLGRTATRLRNRDHRAREPVRASRAGLQASLQYRNAPEPARPREPHGAQGSRPSSSTQSQFGAPWGADWIDVDDEMSPATTPHALHARNGPITCSTAFGRARPDSYRTVPTVLYQGTEEGEYGRVSSHPLGPCFRPEGNGQEIKSPCRGFHKTQRRWRDRQATPSHSLVGRADGRPPRVVGGCDIRSS